MDRVEKICLLWFKAISVIVQDFQRLKHRQEKVKFIRSLFFSFFSVPPQVIQCFLILSIVNIALGLF